MPIQSKNPSTEEVLKTFEEISENELVEKINLAQKTFIDSHSSSVCFYIRLGL